MVIRCAVYHFPLNSFTCKHFILRWLSKPVLQICRLFLRPHFSFFLSLHITLLASIYNHCTHPTNHFVHTFASQFKQPAILFMSAIIIFTSQTYFSTNSSSQSFSSTDFANHFVFFTTTCLSNSTTNSATHFPLSHYNQLSQLIFFSNHFAKPTTTIAN